MNQPVDHPAPRAPSTFVARVSLLVIGLAAILLAVGVGVWNSTSRFVLDNEWVAHTYEVENAVSAVLAQLGTLQADAVTYAATGDQANLARFSGQQPLLEADLTKLTRLVRDNPSQIEHVRDFAAAVRELRDAATEAVEARRTSGRMPAQMPNLGLNGVRGMSRVVLDQEDDLLVERRLASDRTATMTRMLTGAAVALSLCFLAFTFWLVRTVHLRSVHSQDSLRASNAQLADALAETRRISESMHKLTQLGELLQSCRSLDEVREGLGGALGDLLPGLGGRLALINPSQNLAAIGAHWGRHSLLAESVFAPEDCWALRRGQAYPLAGTSSSFVCRHVQLPNPDLPEAGYLCVPLTAQGEMIGVLTFDGDHAPTLGERRVALAAAEQLALALANLRLQDTLRTQSIRDPLTGLFNRRYLEVSLERELLRAARRSSALAVLMLDIDHFKRFNDSHGHEAGDALLAQFAEVLKRSSRGEDIACRYGGEEFTVLLLDSDAAATAQRAEQIRASVAEISAVHRNQQLPHVTVSIGWSVFPRDGRASEDLMRRADAALYQAKKAGRDRVVSFEAMGDLHTFETRPA
ncbi:MAG TPA: diguanylate cyclase [Rudaea sp.]|nr:diguanylate cyclase [Rudaea sp.]